MTAFQSFLDQGRAAYTRRAWAEAYTSLSGADRISPLDPADLERLAIAARLLGHDRESADVMARAHQACLARGDPARAARCAVWLALRLLIDGETAPSAGWVARARRLLDECPPECVERGYLLLPVALKDAFGGDVAAAETAFAEAVRIGEHHGDRDLTTLGRHGQGRGLLRRGDVAGGMALLDEVMVAVTAGEVSPLVVGDIYCSVIEACHETFDLRRAQEWTAALDRWCADQPDMTPYRGLCLIRRAELLQLHGEWPDAVEQTDRACERLSGPPPHHSLGMAFYQRAELHRLRGELAEAEACYREVSRLGREPHPGLALVWLAQGRVEAAAAAIRRLACEAKEPRARARALAASVDILLTAGDTAGARASAEELASLAARFDAPLLHALSAGAAGAVLLAAGEPGAALAALRASGAAWRGLDAPYEAARIRALVARVHAALGDRDSAALELDAARHAFAALGANLEVARMDALARQGGDGGAEPAGDPASPLTSRELEVLRLVATGRTNRGIAEALGISEKTVARHVSNIFTKLGIGSRAAATAWAYQRDLVVAPVRQRSL